MEKILLKPKEVTQYLGLSKSKVYEMITTGQLPSIRIGRCVRVPAKALEQWVEDQQNENNNMSRGDHS